MAVAKDPYLKTLTQGRDHMARLAALLGVLTPVWFAISALGVKWGWWGWREGLTQLPLAGLAMIVVVALFSLYAVLVVRPWGGRILTAVAFLAPIVTAGAIFALVAAPGLRAPPIHDVSTDLGARTVPSAALLAARGADANRIEPPTAKLIPDNPRFRTFAGQTVAAAQAAAYPDVQPLTLQRPPAEAFAAAEAAVKAQGWTIVTSDAATGTIEATAETFWYGFKDDVIVKVTPDGAGARVDVRSISRVGLSDLGANAKRVAALLAAIRAG